MAERVVLENIAYTQLGRMLILCGASVPSDVEVAQWAERLSRPGPDLLLISARGSYSINSKQRAMIADRLHATGRKPPRVAMLSNAAISRFVVQAMAWLLGSDMRVFGEKELEAAVKFLQPGVTGAEIEREMAALHAALGARPRQAL